MQNGYGAHDIGGFVDLMAPRNKATLRVGVQNGSRESAADVNNTKSFYGRATATSRLLPASSSWRSTSRNRDASQRMM